MLKLKAALSAAALLVAGAALAADWKPTQRVEVVVGVAPGGAMDRTARFVADNLKRTGFVPANSIVLNKPGGAHAVALSYTIGKKGDPDLIQIVNTPIITNRLLGRSPLSYRDVTPIAVLFEERMVFATHPDSPIKSAADLVKRLKADPASVSFSVSSGIGTANHFAVMLLAQALGIDPRAMKTVSFDSAAEGITATLGRHIDVVVTTPSALVPFAEAGQLRMLAIAADERLRAPLADVPTWKEQGLDVDVGAWRAVVAPPNLNPDEVKGWEKAITAVTSTDEWKAEADREFLNLKFLGAAQADAFFKSEDQRFGGVLKNLGLAN